MKAGTSSVFDDLSTVKPFSPVEKESCGLLDGVVREFQAPNVQLDACASYSIAHFRENAIRTLGKSSERTCVIFVVRDPLVRLESHMRHLESIGRLPAYNGYNLRSLIDLEPALIQASHYASILSDWEGSVGSDQLFVFDLEDYRRDRDSVVRQVVEIVSPASIDVLHGGEAQWSNSSDQALRISQPLLRKFLASRPYRRMVRGMIPADIRAKLLSSLGRRSGDVVQLSKDDERAVFQLLATEVAAFGQRHPRIVEGWTRWKRVATEHSEYL